MLYHHVARAIPGRLLFRDVPEASALWAALKRAFPDTVASCLMPDHVHLAIEHVDPADRLSRVMTGHARLVAHRRGGAAGLWAPRPEPVAIADADKVRLTVRYIHLNPTRKRLVRDPLAWPWSTYRDRLGFAASPLGEAVPDPARLHRTTSDDATVAIGGTAMPRTRFEGVGWTEVTDAVLAVCRAGPEALHRRGAVRTLALKTAWIHGLRDGAFLRRALRLSRTAVFTGTRGLPARNAVIQDAALAACVTVAGDPRFTAPIGWGERDGWRSYFDYADAPLPELEWPPDVP